MNLPKEGDVITAVIRADEKVYVFSKDWHIVLDTEGEPKAKRPQTGAPRRAT